MGANIFINPDFKFWDERPVSVPGYTQLSYVETIGHCPIETDIMFEHKDQIFIDFEFVYSNPNGRGYVFKSENRILHLDQIGGVPFARLRYCHAFISFPEVNFYERVVMKFDDLSASVNERTYSIEEDAKFATEKEPSPLIFFVSNHSVPPSLRFRSFKMHDCAGELVSHLIPMRRHRDNRVGLMDLVTEEFYASPNDNLVGSYTGF